MYIKTVSLLVHSPAPSGPPLNVQASIHSSSSIAVGWSASVGGADGYVILYSVEGGSNMTQLVEGGGKNSTVLTELNKGQLYTIRVFAYKELTSPLSESVVILLERELLATCVLGRREEGRVGGRQ